MSGQALIGIRYSKKLAETAKNGYFTFFNLISLTYEYEIDNRIQSGISSGTPLQDIDEDSH